MFQYVVIHALFFFKSRDVENSRHPVAVPGFDLRGDVDFVNEGGGGVENQWKCWRLKVSLFKRVLDIFLLKLCLELIASEEKNEKN